MDVTDKLLENGDLELTIEFDELESVVEEDADESDAEELSEKDELEELLKTDPQDVESQVCESFFNGNYRYWTEEDKIRCGDMTSLDGITTIHEYDNGIFTDPPEWLRNIKGWKKKTLKQINALQYSKFADEESWFYNSCGCWFEDLIKNGSVVFTARKNLHR